MKFGLLGRKLSHSYSPQIHKFFYDYDYNLYEVEPNEINNFFDNLTLDGFNITIPYKKDVIKYCDKLSKSAKKIGAVNTIVVDKNGILTGYNTDYYGFSEMINSLGVDVCSKKAVIFGSGGASVTCKVVLEDLGASEVIVVSRKGENNYNNLSKHFDAEIIVNATPIGMFPSCDASITDLADFKNCKAVYDLIYNPAETLLLKQANELNIPNSNGLLMLISQAKQSAELFINQKIDNSIIKKIEKELKI